MYKASIGFKMRLYLRLDLVLTLHGLLHRDLIALVLVEMVSILTDNVMLEVVLAMVVHWYYIFHPESVLLEFLLTLLLEFVTYSIVKGLGRNSGLEKLWIVTYQMLLKALIPRIIDNRVVFFLHSGWSIKCSLLVVKLPILGYWHLIHGYILLSSEGSHIIVRSRLNLLDTLSLVRILSILNFCRFLLHFS